MLSHGVDATTEDSAGTSVSLSYQCLTIRTNWPSLFNTMLWIQFLLISISSQYFYILYFMILLIFINWMNRKGTICKTHIGTKSTQINILENLGSDVIWHKTIFQVKTKYKIGSQMRKVIV